jgi:cytochrome P450
VTAATDAISLTALLDPDVLANPYPLYARLRDEQPVYWDPYLHAWVVTRYADVATVLLTCKADRTPTPDRLAALGMQALTPIAELMVRQMLFMDPPLHKRVRGLAAAAFTPRRIARLHEHIQHITNTLVDAVAGDGHADVMADLANPLPAIVTAEMLGVPTSDHNLLKTWSADFAEMLGNFQHNPGRTERVLRSVAEMTAYFRDALARAKRSPGEGLISALSAATVDGDRLSDDEVVANVIVTMVGGQETTTNLIGNGLLTLLRNPGAMALLCDDPSRTPAAVEELLRFESPSQHTARLAPAGTVIGGERIVEGQAVVAVMGSANRDERRFADPDRLDLARADNRHLAFGWAGHFCFGAPLARMEAQIAFDALLSRLPGLHLADAPLRWRPNLGLRGLTELHVRWSV